MLRLFIRPQPQTLKKTDPPICKPSKIRPPLLDPLKKPDHETKSNELAVKLGMCDQIILKYVFFAKKYDSLAISKIRISRLFKWGHD